MENEKLIMIANAEMLHSQFSILNFQFSILYLKSIRRSVDNLGLSFLLYCFALSANVNL